MTQRSAERWNTGKRGAALRKAEQQGFEEAREMGRLARSYLNPEITNEEVEWEMYALGLFDGFSRSPCIKASFRRGAWQWVESQPVEF
ncbi:hypothetical protein AD929_15760 [Gluconobacter potus]|uniref:Uncharacterized protein n=1 Tax=Gluconobacter potus TaxID=2724927 RepID=A0A149QPN0_9PROT|nr:hypothetical protein [Gluconobacter potus]KXU99249.1 hypothetical protein AD929_15760 [Gluconobacter potus]